MSPPILTSARAIAQGVREGSLDPVAVVQEHLARIAQFDGALHAFTAVRDGEAVDDAQRVARSGESSRLPLAGVPVAVKDNTDVAGLPTRYGSAASPAGVTVFDAEVVRRLRAAGAVIIGKTAMPELAIWPFTEGPGWATRNPVDTSRTCGGSSGGSAVAVAAGMAALAVGTDSGGSIRIPAACCGVVGVKPTPGLVPLPGDAANHWYGLTAAGPFARDVADAALILDVLSGSRSRTLRAAVQPGLRVAVSLQHPFPGARVDTTASAVVQRIAHRLAGHGHHVAHSDPPYPQSPLPFLRCYLGGIADDADDYALDMTRAEPRTRAMAAWGRRLRRLGSSRLAPAYPLSRRLRRWFDHWDVVLTPALAYEPPLIGKWQNRGWLTTAIGVARWIAFAPPWNLAGCPAATVSVGRYRDGLPVAIQIAASPGHEALLLDIAAQIEAVSEWAR